MGSITPSPTKKLFKFNILPDSRASEDAFKADGDNGPHERVADVLKEIVIDEEDGFAIALTGSWGSGKSTVVNLLKQDLDKDTFLLFEFDAWEHEGDALRRAFLERLMVFVETRCKPNEEDKRANRRLHDRFKKHQQVTIKRPYSPLTIPGILVALYLIFLPVSAGIAAHAISSGQTWLLWEELWSWRFLPVLQLGILVLVLIALFVWYIIACSCKWSDDCYPLQHRFTRLFANNKPEAEISHMEQERELTSLDFLDQFERLVGIALRDDRKNTKRKLVLVIDNLDRVDPESALSLWSTMRTFFNDSTKERYFLIVPFDQEALTQAWSRRVGPRNRSRAKRRDGKDAVVQEFISKTFRVVIHVPKITLADVKQYFVKKAKFALPDLDEYVSEREPYEVLFRAFDDVYNEHFPTPRQIIHFINNCAPLIASRRFDVSLQAVGVYVALSMKCVDMTKVFNDQDDRVDGVPATQLFPGLKEELIALHYGVSKDDGKHLLYGPRIKECILEAREAFPDDLVDSKGFEIALRQQVERHTSRWRDVLSACRLLDPLAELSDTIRTHVWNCVRSGVVTLGSSGGDFEEAYEWLSDGFVALARHYSDDEQVAERSAEHVRSLLTNLARVDNESVADALKGWARATASLFRHLTTLRDGSEGGDEHTWVKVFRTSFRVDVTTPEAYVELIQYATGNKWTQDAVSYLIPVSTRPFGRDDTAGVVANEVCSWLNHKLNNDEYRAYDDVLLALPQVKYDWDPKDIVNTFKRVCTPPLPQQHKRGNTEINPQDFAIVVKVWLEWAVSDFGNAQAALRQAVKAYHVHHHLGRLGNTGDGRAVAVLAILLYSDTVEPPAQQVAKRAPKAALGVKQLESLASNNKDSSTVLREVAKLIKVCNYEKSLCEWASVDDTKGRLSRVILDVGLSNGFDLSVIDTDLLLNMFRVAEGGSDLSKELKQLLVVRDNIKSLLATQPVDASLELLYIELLEENGESELVEALSAMLDKVDEATWSGAFKDDDGFEYRLARKLHEVNPEFTLATHARDALGKLMSKGVTIADDSLTLLNVDERKHLLRGMFRKVSDNTQACDRMLAANADALCKAAGDLSWGGEEWREFFDLALKEPTIEVVKWLSKLVKELNGVIADGKEKGSVLHGRLKSILGKSDDDEMKNAVRELASVFDISLED